MNAVTNDMPPSFLWGTFDWLANGIVLADQPTLNLLSSEALQHPDPWIVLAAVLERAKMGDHTHARLLQAYFEKDEPLALNRSALLVAGLVVARSDLDILVIAMRSKSPWTRAFAVQAAREVGFSSLIPKMVAAWERAQSASERDIISQSICDLLEPLGGPLKAESNYFNAPPADTTNISNPRIRAAAEERNAREPMLEEFPAQVNAACRELEDEFGSNTVALWAGELRDPVKIAQECWDALPDAVAANDLVQYRRMFEASTGISCADFFRWVELRPMHIQSTLEDFLQTNTTAFVAGTRYFFRHPVP
ncbi:MAG: hypothetical protein AAGF11_10410 [Myxococcota bacterium]